ncbi:MAG: hypothetical protein AAF754_09550 [Pseudomonadota bacterium]
MRRLCQSIGSDPRNGTGGAPFLMAILRFRAGLSVAEPIRKPVIKGF